METETLEKVLPADIEADQKDQKSEVFVYSWSWHPLSDELLEAKFRLKMAGLLREDNGHSA